MSGAGAPTAEALDVSGMRVAIVAASWHDTVMSAMLESARSFCVESGVDAQVYRVPGAFELPIVARACALSGVDAVIALGVVIRGGTPHFDFVCDAATSGLTRVALDTGVPIGFGVLTCDDEQQALDRAGLPTSREDKGREAAHAALSTASVLKGIPTP